MAPIVDRGEHDQHSAEAAAARVACKLPVGGSRSSRQRTVETGGGQKAAGEVRGVDCGHTARAYDGKSLHWLAREWRGNGHTATPSQASCRSDKKNFPIQLHVKSLCGGGVPSSHPSLGLSVLFLSFLLCLCARASPISPGNDCSILLSLTKDRKGAARAHQRGGGTWVGGARAARGAARAGGA